jgi:predicted kinase
MTSNEPTLHLLCGKIAAGKSTLAARLGAQPGAIVVSEDEWLPRLYPGEITTIADYARCSARLRGAIGPHLTALLSSGVTIVLDFPANTLASRAWMRSLFEEAGVSHQLHYLATPDDLCRGRLRARNARGDHPYAASNEEFDLFTSYFVEPGPDEGFNVIVHQSRSAG